MSALLGSLSSALRTTLSTGFWSRATGLSSLPKSTCFLPALGSAAFGAQPRRNLASKGSGGHCFPQFANLPPVHRIAGKGNVYETSLERKRVLKDPNLPNFEHIEPLKWTTWRMLRDVRRRHLFTRYFFKRTALYNTRKCGLLPSFVREAAKEEELRLPRDSMFHMLHIRCAVSGRSRGLLKKYRISRLVWRNLADNNKLSGVIKASWN